MKPKHYQFVINYMQTNDPGIAYGMTYPKASAKSFYAGASRLMALPEVAALIRETQHRAHERALREIEAEQSGKIKEQLLTINEKRSVLTKIITGETKRIRHIKTKYGGQKVEDDLPIYAVLRAIDMDTRLENFYNYLAHPETWRKAQALHINTPTLQQQVNILISQTSQEQHANSNPDNYQAEIRESRKITEALPVQQEKSSPSRVPNKVGGAEGIILSQTTNEMVPPASGKSPLRGFRGPLAPEKTHQPQAATICQPPGTGFVKQTPDYLTLLNKMPGNPNNNHCFSDLGGEPRQGRAGNTPGGAT